MTNHAYGRAVFGPSPAFAIVAVAVLAVFVATAWFAGRESSPTRGATALVVAFLSTAPYALPWYGAWALPMAAESVGGTDRGGARLAIVGLSSASFLAYTEPPGSSGTRVSVYLAWLPVLWTFGLLVWCAREAVRIIQSARAP